VSLKSLDTACEEAAVPWETLRGYCKTECTLMGHNLQEICKQSRDLVTHAGEISGMGRALATIKGVLATLKGLVMHAERW
jgi:hypothetical protein